LRILFIVPSLARGGTERVVVRLSKEFSRKNEVDILIYRNVIEYEIPSNVNVYALQTGKVDILIKLRISL